MQVRDNEGGSDTATVKIATRGSDAAALVVGSNASDTNDQVLPVAHVVDTSPFLPDGAIDGGTSGDILIGDVGGTGLQPSQTGNVVFVSRNGDGVVDQRVQLSGVDLAANGMNSDASILQTLLGNNQLLKD